MMTFNRFLIAETIAISSVGYISRPPVLRVGCLAIVFRKSGNCVEFSKIESLEKWRQVGNVFRVGLNLHALPI